MKRFACIAALVLLGCSPKRPPPQVCEPPPPEPRGTRVGECPVSWQTDAGADALGDGSADDAHGAADAGEYHPPR